MTDCAAGNVCVVDVGILNLGDDFRKERHSGNHLALAESCYQAATATLDGKSRAKGSVVLNWVVPTRPKREARSGYRLTRVHD